MSTSPSSPNLNVHSASLSPKPGSVILESSGSSPRAFTGEVESSQSLRSRAAQLPTNLRLRTSSGVYLRMTSAGSSSWRESSTMSPCLIHTYLYDGDQGLGICQWVNGATVLCIFFGMCASHFSPSKHCASSCPSPSILVTWAYSCPSSRNTSSRLSSSFSFLPRLRFFPPCPDEINYKERTCRWKASVYLSLVLWVHEI